MDTFWFILLVCKFNYSKSWEQKIIYVQKSTEFLIFFELWLLWPHNWLFCYDFSVIFFCCANIQSFLFIKFIFTTQIMGRFSLRVPFSKLIFKLKPETKFKAYIFQHFFNFPALSVSFYYHLILFPIFLLLSSSFVLFNSDYPT
jgi:hypothetical protein